MARFIGPIRIVRISEGRMKIPMGLLCQFFPKGTDFNEIREEEIDGAAALLNNRPRKWLDYWAPHEVSWSG